MAGANRNVLQDSRNQSEKLELADHLQFLATLDIYLFTHSGLPTEEFNHSNDSADNLTTQLMAL